MKKRIISILLLLVLTISLIGCAKNDPEVVSINNQIEELENSENNQESILKVISLREEINKLSNQQKRWINTKKLNELSDKTSNGLKDSVPWSQYLSKDDDYLLIDSITDISKIICIWIYPRMGMLSSQLPPPRKDKEYINLFAEIINIPYVEVTNYSYCLSMIKDAYSIKEFNNERKIGLSFNETEKENRVLVQFLEGWIYISYKEDDTTKAFVSLIKVSSEQEISLFGY